MNDPDKLVCLDSIRCWLLDMDGTISLGEQALPGSVEFLTLLSSLKADFIFLTNNSSHSAAHYIRRLNRMGVPVTRDQILTATDALAALIRETGPDDRSPRVFAVGTPDFLADLTEAGLTVVNGRDRDIDYVLLGFDTTLTYEKLDIACDYIRSGVPYYAANPDRVCPLENGKVLPDCGALIAFMETCTGRNPIRVIGKPDPAMAEMVQAGRGYRKSELAMVGDRLYTDIAFARNAGIAGIAVLSGETTMKEISQDKNQPDLVFKDIRELAAVLLSRSRR